MHWSVHGLGRALVGAWVGAWCMGDVGDLLGGVGLIGSSPHPIFTVKLPRISFFTPLKLCSEMPV